MTFDSGHEHSHSVLGARDRVDKCNVSYSNVSENKFNVMLKSMW